MLVLRWSRLQSYQWMKLNESWKCNLSTKACSLKSLSSQLLLLNRQFLHIVAIYVCVINVSLIQIIVIDSRFLISMTLQCSHVECCVTQVCLLWRDDRHNCSDSAPIVVLLPHCHLKMFIIICQQWVTSHTHNTDLSTLIYLIDSSQFASKWLTPLWWCMIPL